MSLYYTNISTRRGNFVSFVEASLITAVKLETKRPGGPKIERSD